MQTNSAEAEMRSNLMRAREQLIVKINRVREENEQKDEILRRLEKEYKEMKRRQKELEEEMKSLSEKNQESEKFQVEPSSAKNEVSNKDGPF